MRFFGTKSESAELVSSIDFSAIGEPTTSAQVREFRRAMRGKAEGYPKRTPINGRTGVLLACAIVMGTAASVIVGVNVGALSTLGEATADSRDGTIASLVFGVILFGMAVTTAAFVPFRTPYRTFRELSRFAAANGLQYRPLAIRPRLPGILFRRSAAGPVFDKISGRSPRYFEMGNYRYSRFNRHFQETVWGYIAIKVDRKLPHIVLHAAKNKEARADVSADVDTSQTLRLEGDFNKHFTLYAPRAYERDALYVFAPDLMALMIDNASSFDVEIVDDWILFYSPRRLAFYRLETLNLAFRIIEVVGAKFERQTQRYSDDRAGTFAENRVAEPGRRLRIGFPLVLGGATAVLTAIVSAVVRSWLSSM